LSASEPLANPKETEMTATAAAARRFSPAQLFVLFAILFTLVTGAAVALAHGPAGSARNTGVSFLAGGKCGHC
jgi:hypothetical protein